MNDEKLTSRSLGAGPAGPDAATMPAGGEGIRALGAETVSDAEAWRAWFAANVQPELDKMPALAAPCPSCGLTYAEPGTICGYCFLCHGRGHCEDDGVRCYPVPAASRAPNAVQPASEPAAATGAPGAEASEGSASDPCRGVAERRRT